MGSIGRLCHIVITPSRDESEFLPHLIRSMSEQTITPSQWIIVDHNSSDSTRTLIEEASNRYDWISYVSVIDENPRKRGFQIARLFNTGISNAQIDWEFCSKIDADMVLPVDYFDRIFKQFSTNENLGIASGSCFVLEGRRKVIEYVSEDHTRGGLKTYNRDCFEEIGGIREVDGWDGIDNLMAQMFGWETRNFSDIEVEHKRRTGSYSGLLRGCFESGQFAYSMNYYLPFIVARSIHRMLRKPLFFGGLSMMFGYVSGMFAQPSPSIEDEKVIKFLRNKQKKKLLFWRKKENQ